MNDAAGPQFSTSERENGERNWTPMIVGLVLVIIVVGAIAYFGRSRQTVATQADPYSQFLKVGDIKLSAADNFVGATVTYLDFTLTNAGQKTVAGGQVEVNLKNSLGQVVQTETLPLRALTRNELGGYEDVVDLSRSPLAPGQTKTIRLTLEHVSGDWDQTYPDMKFINLTLK